MAAPLPTSKYTCIHIHIYPQQENSAKLGEGSHSQYRSTGSGLQVINICREGGGKGGRRGGEEKGVHEHV